MKKTKDIMPVLVICKFKKDLNKNGESVFSDAQGQLTLLSVMGSVQSNL